MNIIITGATGFIGSQLVFSLAQDPRYNLLLIMRSKKNIKNSKSIHYQKQIKYLYFNENSNIQDLVKSFKNFKPAIIIHLATCYINAHDSDNIDELFQSNIIFGTKVIEAGVSAGCKKIINTSTIWEYYQNKKIPVNLYAATKSAFDQILNFYYSSNDLVIITLYLSDTYGEFDKRKKLIPLLLKEMNSSKTIKLTSGNQKLELFHIEDIINLYKATIKKIIKIKNPTKANFFPKGEQKSIRELILVYQKCVSSRLKFKFNALPDRKREVFKISKGKSDIQINWRAKKKIKIFFESQYKSIHEVR